MGGPTVHNRHAIARQLSFGVIAGCAITSLPWLVSKMNNEALWPVNFLLTPGTIVALLLSGNFHDYNMTVVLAVNVIFYATITYLLLGAHDTRKAREATPSDRPK